MLSIIHNMNIGRLTTSSVSVITTHTTTGEKKNEAALSSVSYAVVSNATLHSFYALFINSILRARKSFEYSIYTFYEQSMGILNFMVIHSNSQPLFTVHERVLWLTNPYLSY